MSVSTTRSEPQTVKFRGVDDLVLVADEWNRGAATAATSGGGADSTGRRS